MDKRYILDKLERMRGEWKKATPAGRMWIEMGAKILKEKLQKLEKPPFGG